MSMTLSWLLLPVDAVALLLFLASRVRRIRWPARVGGGVQAAEEGVLGALGDVAAARRRCPCCPSMKSTSSSKVVMRRSPICTQLCDFGVMAGLVGEVALDDGDGEGELAGLGVGLGEEEAQQAVLAELAQRPEVGVSRPPGASRGAWTISNPAFATRRPERDVLEGAAGQAELRRTSRLPSGDRRRWACRRTSGRRP